MEEHPLTCEIWPKRVERNQRASGKERPTRKEAGLVWSSIREIDGKKNSPTIEGISFHENSSTSLKSPFLRAAWRELSR